MLSPFLAWGCSFSHLEHPLYPNYHFSYHSGDQNTPWSIIQLKVHQDGILMLNYDNFGTKDMLSQIFLTQERGRIDFLMQTLDIELASSFSN